MFPANGDYKAELTVWRLPENMLATQFEGGSTGQLRRNARLEKPARPTGWYYYSFRFTLQASAEVELSAERMEQGGTVAAAFTGMVGETAPTVKQTWAMCRLSVWAAGGAPISRRPTMPLPVRTK